MNWMEGVNNRITMNKKYFIYSAVIIATLIVFVVIYENKGNYYKESVEDTHARLSNEDINISPEELETAGSEILQLDIVSEGELSEKDNSIIVPADNLLDRNFLKRLKKHKGTIAIVSQDEGLAAQAWVILTRKGINHIKIPGINANETFEYTFVPESQ